MTTTQKLAELKKLTRSAAVNLYRRLQLCAEVLSDLDWMARTFDGDVDVAEKALEDQYFPDIAGYLKLSTAVAIYRKFPDEVTWKQHHYVLNVMQGLYQDSLTTDDEDEDVRTRQTKSWKVEAEKENELRVAAETRLKSVVDTVSEQRDEIHQLKARIEELTAENNHLRGRIEEMERRFSVPQAV